MGSQIFASLFIDDGTKITPATQGRDFEITDGSNSIEFDISLAKITLDNGVSGLGSIYPSTSFGGMVLNATPGNLVLGIGSADQIFLTANDVIQGAWVFGGVGTMMMAVGDGSGNQLIITNYGNRSKNHDHATQTDPGFFVHSDTDPDSANDEWISLSHNKTNPEIGWGSGELVLGTPSGDLTLTNGPALADDIVTTAQLKTSSGEVTTGAAPSNVTMPGGEYGFYPQIKNQSGSGTVIILGADPGGTYVTNFCLNSGSGTASAKQRYVTASGKDFWMFLLIHKGTGKIISTYAAPDHPAYGNGGNFDEVPHPFHDVDLNIHEIVVLNDDDYDELIRGARKHFNPRRTPTDELFDKFEVDLTETVPFKEKHSGQFLGRKPVKVKNQPKDTVTRRLKRK